MTSPRSKVRVLAEKLMGYGDKDYDVCELTHEECLELDSIVFECKGCNHWFPQRENATRETSQWTCRECAEEEKEV